MKRLAHAMRRNRRLARAASSGNVAWKLLLIILLLLILAGAAGMTDSIFGSPSYMAGSAVPWPSGL